MNKNIAILLNGHTNSINMNNLLWIVAVVLIISWVLGFAIFHVGGIIHALLVIAVIAVLFNLISGRRSI